MWDVGTDRAAWSVKGLGAGDRLEDCDEGFSNKFWGGNGTGITEVSKRGEEGSHQPAQHGECSGLTSIPPHWSGGCASGKKLEKNPQNSGKIYKTFLKHMYSSCFHVLSLTLRHCLCPQFSAAATISVHHLSNFLLGNWIFRNFSHLSKGFTLSN